MPEIKLRPIVFKVVQPPYVLLDEKAPATYTQSYGTMYTPPTFTTDKDFICYKMAVHPTGGGNGAGVDIRSYVNDKNYGWYLWSSYDGSVQLICENTENSPTPLTAGTDGERQYGPDDNCYYCNPNPMITASTTEFETVKFVFQKSTRKVYFYIEGKQVAICNNWTTAWNPLERPITNVWNGDTAFGIQVYACDTLEAALEC